jgi:hypothetical protein
MPAEPIPDGYHALTSYLVLKMGKRMAGMMKRRKPGS